MCGITGYAGFKNDAAIKPMTRELAHRGPEDEGTWVRQTPSGVVALGHRRLSIIDLAGGGQPLSSQDGSLVLIANGEIYNHEKLRKDLERKGHRFKTRSDCEAILHLYEEYGLDLFEHLEGMYAFALWDDREERLLLARDPIGKKPLYFIERDGCVVFGSEPKAISKSGLLPDQINVDALNLYLRFGYVPAPLTFYEGLQNLPAGAWLTWKAGRSEQGQHFQLADAIDRDAGRLDFNDAVLRARGVIEDAVSKRLVSDVPVGVFLSGGVDSSLIAALAARASDEPLRTFTVGHGVADASFDERDRARAVSRAIGSEHTELRIEPAVDQLLDELVDAFDEPFADSSAIPNFLISHATSHTAKVVLSGVGGDEAFAGYPRHLGLRWSLWADRLPHWLRRGAQRFAPWVRESSDVFNTGGRVRRFLEAMTLAPSARYLAWTTLFDETARERILSGHARMDRWSLPSHEAQMQPLDFAFFRDATTYLPDDLLRLVDRTSMAHGLEVRAPFCDPKVLGFALGLRPEIKMRRGFELKSVLKEAARGVVPDEILSGPKRGFMIPVARWLRAELRPLGESLLSQSACEKGGLLRYDAVDPLWQAHVSGRQNHAHRLWALLALQAWRLRHPHLEIPS